MSVVMTGDVVVCMADAGDIDALVTLRRLRAGRFPRPFDHLPVQADLGLPSSAGSTPAPAPTTQGAAGARRGMRAREAGTIGRAVRRRPRAVVSGSPGRPGAE